jgi:hypothetical protein
MELNNGPGTDPGAGKAAGLARDETWAHDGHIEASSTATPHATLCLIVSNIRPIGRL